MSTSPPESVTDLVSSTSRHGVTAASSRPTRHASLADLEARAQALIAAADSPATVRAYTASVQRWERWCEGRDVPAWPIEAAHVCNWLADLLADGNKPATLARHVAALGALCAAAGLPSVGAHPAVRRALKGARNVSPKGRGAAYVSPDDMGVVSAYLATKAEREPIAARNRALLLLGYGGALRSSELTALTVGDVEIRTWGAVLTLRQHWVNGPDGPELRAGTKASGAEVEQVEVRRARVVERCPVDAWAAWLDVHPNPEPGAWAFPAGEGRGRPGWASGAALRPLRPRALRDLCARLRRRLGVPVTPHGLRVGYLTTGARMGASVQQLKDQARHASAATTLRYIRAASLGGGPEVL